MKFGSKFALNIAAATMIVGAPTVYAQQEAQQPDAEPEINYPDDAKVNLLYVFGDDPCPESTGDVINVCGELPESERYRVPKILRNNPNDPANQSWTDRAVSLRTVGDSGTNSCSTSGAGGFTGCTQELIDNAVAVRKNRQSVQFGKLIEEERQKRLDLIDGEAEDVERRIVEFEKARAEKEAAEAAAQNSLDPQLEVEAAIEAEGDLPDPIAPQ